LLFVKGIIMTKKIIEDQSIDQLLRPLNWSDYVGQDKIKEHLRIIIEAARKRNEPIDHLLFTGPAGLGKTTLAYISARDLGSSIKVTSGPALEKVGDLAAILTNLEKGSVLFIDEIHRLNSLIEEVLYPAMESYKLHLVLGKGPSARTISIDLAPFTLIAATTRPDLISSPLRSRFGAIFNLDYYSDKNISDIIRRSAKILNIKINEEAINSLAKASRRTPRTANRLLKRVRDFAEVSGAEVIDQNVISKALNMMEIDELGLEPADRRLLKLIIEKFNGGPVGINTLAAALGEEKSVIEEIYEPYLMSLGLLKRTSAGRVVLEEAYRHLKINHQNQLL
jgi:Holliday junction DNA helicase RuvB